MTTDTEWTAPTIERRENVPCDTERESLDRYLDWHRETLLWKCGGLSGSQLASRPLPTTNLSLLGLLRHMALVERAWFRLRFAGDSELGQVTQIAAASRPCLAVPAADLQAAAGVFLVKSTWGCRTATT